MTMLAKSATKKLDDLYIVDKIIIDERTVAFVSKNFRSGGYTAGVINYGRYKEADRFDCLEVAKHAMNEMAERVKLNPFPKRTRRSNSIDHTSDMETRRVKMAEQAKTMGCCGLAAVSLVTNSPLYDTYVVARDTFNKKKSWRGITSVNQIAVLVKSHIPEAELVAGISERLNIFMANADKDGVYLCMSSNHAFVVYGDWVADQCGFYDKCSSEFVNRNVKSYIKLPKGYNV